MNQETQPAPELEAITIEGHTRGAFIMRGAVAAGAVYGLGSWARSWVAPSPRTARTTWTS